MTQTMKSNNEKKTNLHPRNKHRDRYDYQILSTTLPELRSFVYKNDFGNDTINYFDPQAVKALTKALLLHFYNIKDWTIPEGFLCAPIPGRVDYIHYLADLLAEYNKGIIPIGKEIRCLDIGVGANCIYPILGHRTYGWSFVGIDISEASLESAENILASNPDLQDTIDLRLQTNAKDIFRGAILEGEKFQLSICNPPFHASAKAATAATHRKLKNLNSKDSAALNFGGQHNELWCEGGELSFVSNMIRESIDFKDQVTWFTSLLSKKENVTPLTGLAKSLGVSECKTINMAQGAKASRFIAWRF